MWYCCRQTQDSLIIVSPCRSIKGLKRSLVGPWVLTYHPPSQKSRGFAHFKGVIRIELILIVGLSDEFRVSYKKLLVCRIVKYVLLFSMAFVAGNVGVIAATVDVVAAFFWEVLVIVRPGVHSKGHAGTKHARFRDPNRREY